MSRRRAWNVLAAVVALAWLGSPAAADAHLRSGTVAVDYQASISSAGSGAYRAQIFASDRALSLTVRAGHTVVLLGYLGEPVLRLDADGLWVNAASPTAMVLRLARSSRHSVPAGPIWRLRPGQHTVIWPDARTQSLPAGVQRGTWHVPLVVDGRHAILQGLLRRFPAPEWWPWALTLGVLMLAGVLPMLVGRRDLGDAMAMGAAAVVACAAIAIVVAFSLDAYASPGTWIEAVNTIACIGVGVGVLVIGPRHWRAAAAGGIGFLGLAVGLLDGAVFLHPIVLSVLPSGAVRILDVVAIGAGLDAAALSAWFYTDIPSTAAGGSDHPGSEIVMGP
jgi:hypothetical protein